jgi:predicted DNA binding CopG/RHH family protein
MKKSDSTDERQILASYEKGEFRTVARSKADFKRYKDAARATLTKNRRVNIRLSSSDLMDIQERAAEEGVPYQTLIASVLHKFVSGRLIEKPSRRAPRVNGRPKTRNRPAT